MMYKNNMAFAIKSAGKVLREFGETVYLPYGCEYNILLKNMSFTRALVNISIDGNEVVPDGLVIGPSSEIELERFVKDLNKGNRFKFVERTSNIENNRGIRIEDGLIRVSFQYEKKYPIFHTWSYPTNNTWYPDSNYHKLGSSYGPVSGSLTAFSSNFVASASVRSLAQNSVSNENGITVPGSQSNQKFTTVSSFPVESETTVMIIKLLGETEANKQIREPITVKSKQKCVTCGRTNKSTSKFCSECGTALEIFA